MTELLRVNASVKSRGLDANFTCDEGEHIAVVGPNGAGKSTLLQLIAGMLHASSGEIWLDGTQVAGATIHVGAHRRRIAHVEQRPLLFPHLDVLGNVMFGPLAHGASRAEARERAWAEIEAFGCHEYAHRRPHQLSGGEAQRVTLARTLAANPRLVLLDEPMNALDAALAPDIRRTLRTRLARLTTLIVTHNMLDLVGFADRIITLQDGRIIEDGSAESLISAPTTPFLAALTGLNLLVGRVAATGDVILDEERIAGLSLEHGRSGQEVHIVFPTSGIALTYPDDDTDGITAVVVGMAPRPGGVAVELAVGDQHLHADLPHDDFFALRPEIGDVCLVHIDPARTHVRDADRRPDDLTH